MKAAELYLSQWAYVLGFGVVVTACVLVVLSVGHAAGEAREETSTLPAAASSFVPREEARQEISGSRGEIEDDLRIRVLEAFKDKERVHRLREILNAPWDEDGVEDLWRLVLYEGVKDKRHRPLDVVRKGRILDLMAYVHTAYRGKEKEQQVVDLVQARFDSLFRKIADDHVKWPPYHRARLYAVAINALEEYGSPDLLGLGFWECFETYEEGFTGLRLLRARADGEALKKLKRLDRLLESWGCEDRGKRQMLEETIRSIEERFARAREENDDKK